MGETENVISVSLRTTSFYIGIDGLVTIGSDGSIAQLSSATIMASITIDNSKGSAFLTAEGMYSLEISFNCNEEKFLSYVQPSIENAVITGDASKFTVNVSKSTEANTVIQVNYTIQDSDNNIKQFYDKTLNYSVLARLI